MTRNGRMTEDQAHDLAATIVRELRPTPSLESWKRKLLGLNHARAWRIYDELLELSEHGLTIAAYIRHYNSDLAAERAATASPPPHCELCDGHGWVHLPPAEAHRPEFCNGTPGVDDGPYPRCRCTAVRPCRCSTGKAAAAQSAKFAETNGAPLP